MNITKKDYILRYLFFWITLFFKAAFPVIIIWWKFGLFKLSSSIFSQFTGMALISIVISIYLLEEELVEFMKELENKGWYKSIKRTMFWTILFASILVLKFFVNNMLWVVGSFAVSSGLTIITKPIHFRYKNKIKKAKQVDK
jgi:hypothetical protein